MKEINFPGRTPDDLFDEGLLTVQEAASFLHISRSCVYNLMANGHLQYVPVGGTRRIPKKAIVAYLKSGLRGGWANT